MLLLSRQTYVFWRVLRAKNRVVWVPPKASLGATGGHTAGAGEGSPEEGVPIS